MTDRSSDSTKTHYGFYCAIWVALIILLVGGTLVPSLSISKAAGTLLILFISLIKAILVILFYMHLKGEKRPVWAVAIFPFFLIGLAVGLVLIGISLG